MNEWLTQLDINSVFIGLFTGLIIAFFIAVSAMKVGRRKGAATEADRLQPFTKTLEYDLEARKVELADSKVKKIISDYSLSMKNFRKADIPSHTFSRVKHGMRYYR